MTETSGPGSPTPPTPSTQTPPTQSGRPSVRCDQCGQEVPALSTCIRCGDPLAEELRRGRSGRLRDGYAASPDERPIAVRLVSTLYPALPREEIRTFQTALLAGAAVIVVLAALGFFPAAIVAAAVLVPLVTIIYMYDVDLYEDQPVRVVGLTFVWGAVTGALFAFALEQVLPVQAASGIGGSALGGGGAGFDWGRAVIAPLVAGLLMAAGPMLMLTRRHFNDVLDGATFGTASAVAFVGAQTIVVSLDLFRSGLQPGGEVVPWVVRLVGLGVAMPVIATGAIGGLMGVLWLRYRAPDEHEDLLGPLGHPLVAAIMAAVLLVGAAAVQVLIANEDVVGQLLQLAALVIIAILALLWLRRIIHLGLLQESLDIPVGPDIKCASCGKQTPSHSFCGECGVSLRALPKARGAHLPVASASAIAGGVAAPHEVRPTAAPDLPASAAAAAVLAAGGRAVPRGPVPAYPSDHAWLSPRGLLIVFGVVLGAIMVVALVIAFVIAQGLDRPACPDRDLPCAGAALAVVAGSAATNDVPFPPLARYVDDDTGFAFDYDPQVWTVAQQDRGFVLLSAFNGALAYMVEAAPLERMDRDRLYEARRSLLSQRLLGFDEDRTLARRLLGIAILGHRSGVGALFGGALDSPQGPSTDFAVALVGSTDGQIVAVSTILVPAEAREFGLQLADTINNSFTWPTDPVVQ